MARIATWYTCDICQKKHRADGIYRCWKEGVLYLLCRACKLGLKVRENAA